MSTCGAPWPWPLLTSHRVALKTPRRGITVPLLWIRFHSFFLSITRNCVTFYSKPWDYHILILLRMQRRSLCVRHSSFVAWMFPRRQRECHICTSRLKLPTVAPLEIQASIQKRSPPHEAASSLSFPKGPRFMKIVMGREFVCSMVERGEDVYRYMKTTLLQYWAFLPSTFADFLMELASLLIYSIIP